MRRGAEPPQEPARARRQAWVSFITTGSPGWAAYDLTKRSTMVFDEVPAVVSDALAFEREVWAGVV